jgi:DNA-nicking Smr family endonuclease
VPSPQVDDQTLFRRAVSDVRPIGPGNHAEIKTSRPAPVPRHARDKDDTPPPPPNAQGITDASLAAAFAGVTPLADTGRAELESRARFVRRTLAQTENRLAAPPALTLPHDEDDPAALFRYAVGGAQPLSDKGRAEVSAPPPPPEPRQRRMDETAALDESLAASFSFEDRLDSGEEASFLRPGLPRRVLVDLRRGRWVPQDKIDLHGLKRDEAHTALSLFITAALAQGKRCVRIIHGQGHGSPGGVPILKQLSRSWLAQREEVLAFCQANPHEGGAGALLVLLRAPGGGRS